MQNDDEPLNHYVRKVQEETHRFAQALMTENEKLRQLVGQLKNDNCGLEEQVQKIRDELGRHREQRADLEQQVAEVEADKERVAMQYLAHEQQVGNLMNLYVASYRLHGTLDRAELLNTIKEIVANLIGSEEMGVFRLDEDRTRLHLESFVGIDENHFRTVPLGFGIIGRVARTGEKYFAMQDGNWQPSADEAGLTACIPLKTRDTITGVVAIFRMLQQKPCLGSVDHELLNLLATHAATALYCADLHALVSAMPAR